MKLSIYKTRFIVEDKSVKCVIEYIHPVTGEKHRETGYALCNETDKFDFNIGRKISLARAESKAYNKCAKFIKSFIKESNNFSAELCKFYDKADKVLKHNNIYINSLKSKN